MTRQAANPKRLSAPGLCALLALVAFIGCGSGRGVTACAGDAGHSTCAAGNECLWLHSGGYFCVARCANGACRAGGLCVSNGASSCPTCQDLIDVCE
jgi:hypothetical protein